MKKHKQEINITWKKTWTLQRYKERKQEHDFDLKNNISKYMANASFYRLRFRTIDWWTKKIVGGQPLIWWLVFDIVGCWFLILLADFWYCWLLVLDIVGFSVRGRCRCSRPEYRFERAITFNPTVGWTSKYYKSLRMLFSLE